LFGIAIICGFVTFIQISLFLFLVFLFLFKKVQMAQINSQ